MSQSKFIGRYPKEDLIRYLVGVDRLKHAPDLDKGSRAFSILSRWLKEGHLTMPKAMPDIGAMMNAGNLRVAMITSSLAEAVGLEVTVTAGAETDQFRQVGRRKFIDIAVGETIRGLHELAHAMFGLSEAVAVSWSIRQIMLVLPDLELNISGHHFCFPADPA